MWCTQQLLAESAAAAASAENGKLANAIRKTVRKLYAHKRRVDVTEQLSIRDIIAVVHARGFFISTCNTCVHDICVCVYGAEHRRFTSAAFARARARKHKTFDFITRPGT